jgi:hypothetical protein
MSTMRAFHSQGSFEKCFNATFVALIPEKLEHQAYKFGWKCVQTFG